MMGTQKVATSKEQRREEIKRDLIDFSTENEEVLLAARLMKQAQEVKLVRLLPVLRSRSLARF